jgi:CP family cyanate transporter-like MFS transporter
MSAQIQISRGSEKHRAVAIFCLLVLSFALRPGIVSVGPLLLKIQQDFGLTYSEASLLTSIPDVCMGLFVLCVPAISRRLGANQTVLLSLGLLGAAMLLRAATHSTHLLLFWTMFVGIGIAIAGALIGGWIKEHFPHESSLFMGIYAGGLSIGATIAAGTTGFVAESWGSWRIGAGMWCVLAVTAIVSWSFLTRRFNGAVSGANAKQSTSATIALPWRNKRAWLLAIFFGLSQYIAYACLAWIAPWNSEVHASSVPSGLMLSLFTLLLAAGSFAAGAAAGRFADRRGLLAVGTVVTVAGFAGLAFAPHALPTVYIVLIAFGQGICFALGMTLPLDYTDNAKEAHAWTMFVLCIGYMIAALGPLSFGFLRDRSGGFTASYAVLVLVSVLMLAMIPFLKRPEHRKP